MHSYISHINNNGCHIYVFLFYHDGRHKHAKKLILCFTFEILNYAIKYKI